jgi:radical SAM-linked protein
MQRVLFRFAKREPVRFVSHLDLMRAFERAMRRANFPVGYTQGFNPRPKMAFASALSVGATSEWELCQVDLAEPLAAERLPALADDLNRQFPVGLQILDAWVLDPEKKTLHIQPAAARYELRLEGPGLGSQGEQVCRQALEGVSTLELWGDPDGPDCWRINVKLPVGEKDGVRIRDVVARLEEQVPGARVTAIHRARLWCLAEPVEAS